MRAILLMSMMLLALIAPPCFAQAFGAAPAPSARAAAEAQRSAAPAGQEHVSVQQKRAFGRVMGILIAALVQQSTQQPRSPDSRAGATAASGTMDIEVGEAFRPAVAAATPAADENAAQPSGVASTASPADSDASGVASQAIEPLALQATLRSDGQ
jgi:hypothetical protein